jgi:threonyl-tRNA synthetase
MNTAQQLNLEKQRHSLAHVLAYAVKRLFPDVKIGIGPVTDTGFYYEFDLDHKFTHEDLANIESEMYEIIEENIPFTNIIIPKDQALQTLLQLGETYKTELLNKIPDAEVSFYKTGDDFIDLCRGPHVKSTGELDYFKITKITKNYWMNDSSRPLMQRIQGVAFETKKKLNDYLENQKRLSEINSILIAQKLKYLILEDEKDVSSPIWLKDGILLQQNLTRFLEEQIIEFDFQLMQPPWVSNKPAFLVEKFPEFMQTSQIKGTQNSKDVFYRNNLRSFLVERATTSASSKSSTDKTEFGSVSKTYQGNLHNSKEIKIEHLEDFLETTDAQVISLVKEENLKEVLTENIRLIGTSLKAFGFSQFKTIIDIPDYQDLSKYIYDEKLWEKSISSLKELLLELKIPSRIREGRADFYGPKLTIEVKDKYSRSWEISKITLDPILPSKLLTKDDKQKYFVHTDIVINIERLIDLLLEHGEGSLPLWLEPVQVEIIALESKYNHRAIKVMRELKKENLRVEFNQNTTNPESQIAESMGRHTPYLVIIGEKEANTDSISIKSNGQDIGLMRINEFVNKLEQEIALELDL